MEAGEVENNNDREKIKKSASGNKLLLTFL